MKCAKDDHGNSFKKTHFENYTIIMSVNIYNNLATKPNILWGPNAFSIFFKGYKPDIKSYQPKSPEVSGTT